MENNIEVPEVPQFQSIAMTTRGRVNKLWRILQWILVTAIAFVPKDISIKMNVLLLRILKKHIDMQQMPCFLGIFFIERRFEIPVVYSTDRSTDRPKAVFQVLVALWFILRGDLFYVLPCVILFLCFSVLLTLWLPRLGKEELIVRLFDLRLLGFVCFLFLLVSGKGCGLWLWHSLNFSLTFCFLLESHGVLNNNVSA